MKKGVGKLMFWSGGEKTNLDNGSASQNTRDASGRPQALDDDALKTPGSDDWSTRSPSPRGGITCAVHWIFSLRCEPNTALPLSAEEVDTVEYEVSRRFALENTGCCHSQATLSNDGTPSTLLQIPSLSDTIGSADLIEEAVSRFREKPAAIVCVVTSPVVVPLSSGESIMQDASAYPELAASITRELSGRSPSWAPGIAVALTSVRGCPGASNSVQCETLNLAAGMSYCRVDCDDAYHGALTLPLPDSTAELHRPQAAALLLYEQLRSEVSTARRKSRSSSALAKDATRLDIIPLSPKDRSKLTKSEQREMDEELRETEVSCLSSTSIRNTATVSLKTIEVIVKNLTGDSPAKYTILNHTTERFMNVLGRSPAAMSVLYDVGFVEADYDTPKGAEARLVLPTALLPLYIPEITRTLKVVRRELHARDPDRD